jgi:F-box protein 11
MAASAKRSTMTGEVRVYRGEQSIGAAVREAEAGSRLVISPGLYRESVRIDKPLELVGDGSEGVVELWPHEGPGIEINGTNANTVVRGLSFQGRSESPLIAVENGRLFIEDCTLRGGSPACVVLRRKELVMNRCRISESTTGVFFEVKYSSRSSTMNDCDVFHNSGPGVHTQARTDATIVNCRIYENEGPGIRIEGSSQPCTVPKLRAGP